MIGQAEKCLISSLFINVSDHFQKLKSRQLLHDKRKQNLTLSRSRSEKYRKHGGDTVRQRSNARE